MKVFGVSISMQKEFYYFVGILALLISTITVLFAAYFGQYQYILTTLGAYVQSAVSAVQFEIASGEMNFVEFLFADPYVQEMLYKLVFLIIFLSASAFIPWIVFAPFLEKKQIRDRTFTLKHTLLWYGIYIIYTAIFFVLNLKVSLLDKVILGNNSSQVLLTLVDFTIFIVFLFLFTHTYFHKQFIPKLTFKEVGIYALFFGGLLILNILLIGIYEIFKLMGAVAVFEIIYIMLSFTVLVFALGFILYFMRQGAQDKLDNVTSHTIYSKSEKHTLHDNSLHKNSKNDGEQT
jgi:hypothetical protein